MMSEQEDKWVEVRVRKVTAVVKCLICKNLNKNVDYGDMRITGKVLLHCPKCNTNRQHVVVEKIMEVAGMPNPVAPGISDGVEPDAVEEITEAMADALDSEEPEG